MFEFDDVGESDAIFSTRGRFGGGGLPVWAGGGLFCPCVCPLKAVSQDCDDDDSDDKDEDEAACNLSATDKSVGLVRPVIPCLIGLLLLEFKLRLRPELFWEWDDALPGLQLSRDL